MAEQDHESIKQEESVESQDRGLFDFIGKKEEEKKPVDTISHEFEHKVHVTEPEHKVEEEHKKEEKYESLIEKLTQFDSSSSNSSSDEEEVEEGGEKKKKKKLKDKISGDHKKEEKKAEEKQEEKHEVDTSVPVEKVDEPEEKKGFLEKIKEKLPGGAPKKAEEVPSGPEAVAGPESPKEKKGILEKIKVKLPGYYPKGEEEKEKVEGAHH